ncbi:MAG: sugar phosphate isomerase/epimerase [Prolixibacteraceae bacterium]|jgi:inosose dehydratase|nr:sugar phosphate isomerase/epimerase [Prolixibacteraceae bacterium]
MIKIANAPCSWGVLEFELEGKAAGFAQVLDEIKETGYDGTELGDWGFMPTDPLALKNELVARDLTMVGAFVPVLLKDETCHATGAKVAVQTAKLMADAGYPDAFIVLADDNGTIPERTNNAGHITPALGMSENEWGVFARGADFIAREVKEKTGLRTVFHHHCGGYVETPAEVKRLMNLTNPELVGLVLDMGHYMFGGGDPINAFDDFSDRIWHIHFKDMDPVIADKARSEGWNYFKSVSEGVFCELGKGTVDFKSIVKVLKKIKYDGWIVVEQDVLPGMGNPKECAGRNREFIRLLGI